MKIAVHFWIVTPSYNQEKYIPQTIDSILNQDVSQHLFVIDGGSQDNTVKVLKKYGKKIFWISEKDKGQTDAINKGIKKISQRIKKMSQGKKKNRSLHIFAYLNSDDYYLEDAFQTVTDFFQKNPKAMWCAGDCAIVDAENKPMHAPIALYKQIIRHFYQPWMLYILNPIPQPATFMRWEAVQKVGQFDKQLRYTMDYQYWLRLQKMFGKPVFLKEKLAAFRIHGLSKGGSQFTRQFQEQYQVAQSYTRNTLLLFLHSLHNWLILIVYGLIK